MDKIIATVLMTISAVIAATLIGTQIFPVLTQGAGAISAAGATMDSRIRTNVTVVHSTGDQAAGELYVWIKNTGSVRVDAIDRSDVFLQQPDGSYDRIPYGAGVGQWQYSIEGDTAWLPTATLKVTISLSSVTSGEYRVTFVTPNGVGTQTVFSM